MSILFRKYTKHPGITKDYHKVRAFFIKLGYAEFEYTRWDWMATHSNLDKSAVGRIGLWEEEGEVVGITTFDTQLGTAYCLTLPEYTYLKKEILLYAKDNISKNGDFGVIIKDSDMEFQDIAAEEIIEVSTTYSGLRTESGSKNMEKHRFFTPIFGVIYR